MIYWCNNCSVPIIENNQCPSCDSKLEEIAQDIRPVFFKEKVLVSLILDNENILEKDIWATNRNYYIVDGQKIKLDYDLIKDKERDLSEFRYKFKNLIMNYDSKINSNSSQEKFINYNKQRFKRIEEESENYIKKIANEYREQNYIPIVSFSGGKDSTVISHLVRKALSNQRIIHIFGDTTLEFPYTYEYIDDFKQQNQLTPFFEEATNKDFMELCKVFGPPSRLERWCCTIFKTNPIGQVIGTFPQDKKALTFLGIRKSESQERNDYARTRKKSKISRQIASFPILDWKDSEVWLYILTEKLLFNEAYRLGFTRVGCWLCPNNSLWSEFLTRFYIPDEYNEWRNLLLDYAQKAGKEDYKVYVDEGYWKARRGDKGIDTKLKDIKGSDCQISDEAKSYFLEKDINKDFIEFLKPFGEVKVRIDSNKFEFIVEFKGDKKFEVRGVLNTNVLKVIPYQVDNISVFHKRFKCQIRKYENCIFCSACDNVCPYLAISTVNNKYIIDEDKCINCKECIAHFYNGCLKFQTLK